MRFFTRLLLILWASPASSLGLSLGLLALVSGGRVRYRQQVLEFHGGLATWLLAHLPLFGSALAMTLGHVVIGQTAAGLDLARPHELIHVRQYERWGPLFLPCYGMLSLWLWLRGRHPYLDNPFEREARAASAPPEVNCH